MVWEDTLLARASTSCFTVTRFNRRLTELLCQVMRVKRLVLITIPVVRLVRKKIKMHMMFSRLYFLPRCVITDSRLDLSGDIRKMIRY